MEHTANTNAYDITVALLPGARRIRLHAETPEGREWFMREFSSARDQVLPAAHSAMTLRALRAEGLRAPDVPGIPDDDLELDFHDLQSSLLQAEGKSFGGRSHDALIDLIRLRDAALQSTDPRCGRLLPEIDRAIAAAHRSCRTDVHVVAEGRPARRIGLTWVAARLRRIEPVMLHVAVSIVLMIDLGKFLASVL